jgi:outer membrane protein assembly factor BamB
VVSSGPDARRKPEQAIFLLVNSFRTIGRGGAREPYYSSPVAADGKVYFLSEGCKFTVLRAMAEREVLAVNDLEDACYATPAIADSRLYVRTRSFLYCFGKR